MPSGGGSTNTIQKADPWEGAQPNLLFGLDEAMDLYDRGALAPLPYSGDRVAGFSKDTVNAQQGIKNLAKRQQPRINTASNVVLNMAKGDDGIYRDMDAVRGQVLDSVLPAVQDSFSGAGMTDSSVARQEAATAATAALAPVEYGAYRDAKDRSLEAARAVPAMSISEYMPQQMIGQVGSSIDALNQAQINSAIQAYYEGENREADALSRFSGLSLGYGGQGGTTSTSQSGGGPSTLGTVAGAGLGGLGAYGALSANPATAPFALGGALLAGLGGLF